MCPRLVLQPDKDLLRDADGVPRPFCALLQGLSVIWQRQYGAYSFQGSHQKPANRQKMIFLHWVTCYGEINIEVKNQSIDGNNLLAHCTISSFYNQRSWLLSWGRWVRILQTVKSTIWLTRWNFLHFQNALIKKFLNICHSKAFWDRWMSTEADWLSSTSLSSLLWEIIFHF